MTREFTYMPVFEKQWQEAKLGDDELRDLEILLCGYPDAGDVIQGTGSLRKLRWSLPGKGKRGGIRVLYVDYSEYEQIFMITCFRKSVKETISDSEKQVIKKLLRKIKENLQFSRRKQ